VALSEDVGRIATAAAAHAGPGEELAAVIPVEAQSGERTYLCAFADTSGTRSWLAFAEDGEPVTSRRRVRDAASIAALAEVVEEAAGIDVAAGPRVASLAYVDSLGTRNAGEVAGAVQAALPAVDELAQEIELNYRIELE
jgi:hypothetical protein